MRVGGLGMQLDFPPGRLPVRTHGAYEKYRDFISQSKEMLEQFDRSRIGPVQIVEHQHQRQNRGLSPGSQHHLKELTLERLALRDGRARLLVKSQDELSGTGGLFFNFELKVLAELLNQLAGCLGFLVGGDTTELEEELLENAVWARHIVGYAAALNPLSALPNPS